MTLTTRAVPVIAASTLLVSPAVMAWESQDGTHKTSANIALSSDYMWRGYSQTDDKPAISGGFDYNHSSGLYLGTWGSNVDFDDDASMELDIYAGFTNEFGDSGIGYDIGVLRYIYPGENYGWNELYGALSYSFFTLGIAYSNNVYDSSETGIYYSLGFDYELPAEFSLSAGIGYYDYDDDVYTDEITGQSLGDSATDYRIGITKEIAGLGLDLSYINSNSKAADLYGNDATDGRLVFSISKSM